MPVSLLEFARQPDAAANPLPPLDARKVAYSYGFPSRRAWPVDLLPAAAIAEDLARDGLSFQRGRGYVDADGVRLEVDEVAALAVRVLVDAAEYLPWPRRAALEERLRLGRSAYEDTRASVLAAYDSTDDVTVSTFPDRLLASSTFTRLDLAAVRAELASLPADDPGAVDWRPYEWALRQTADELRTSAAARRRLVDAIRPHLPTPSPSADPGEAVAWLSQFDSRDVLRRSELSALYSEAGRPGDLSPSDLRAAASERWGAPRQLRGIYSYRPSRTTPLDLPASPAPEPRPAPVPRPVDINALIADLRAAYPA